jgi:hypothetical protein
VLPASARRHLPAARSGLAGDLLQQACLADPRLAAHEEEAAAALARVVERGAQLLELARSADERS